MAAGLFDILRKVLGWKSSPTTAIGSVGGTVSVSRLVGGEPQAARYAGGNVTIARLTGGATDAE